MTDALCGPSNALQSFQKHTSVDRTLQQDRLTSSRYSPAQGFRTFDPRAGSLDGEFHAFENTPTNPFQLEQPVWYQNVAPTFPMHSSADWASDFQNLRIANSPIPSHQFRMEAPLVRSAPGDWQQEFARQRHGMSPIAAQKQPDFSSQPKFAPSYMPQSGASSSMQQPFDQYAQQVNPTGSQFSEADFEKAFQDVSNETQFADQVQPLEELITRLHEAEAGQEKSVLERKDQAIQEPKHVKIGSDAIEYTDTKDRTPDHDTRDANDLAKVAGELVHNVSHETNEKFRNSQFLDLMRRIRDREVEVRNNDFEITQQPQFHETRHESEQLRPHDPNTFEFPNMNDVYRVDGPIDMTPDYSDYHPANPRNQMSDLHPGGPLYPEQSPQKRYTHTGPAFNPSLPTDETNAYASA